jgi:hypothetical protein
MVPTSASHLLAELRGYGVAPEKVRLFGQKNPEPDLHDYLALNALRQSDSPAPDGVAENQGRPVLYFVDEQRLGRVPAGPKENLFDDDPSELPVIFRQLACRGERAYLARVQFGKLLVVPVSPTEQRPNWVEYRSDSTAGRCLFSRLSFGITEGEDFAAGDAVFDRLFELLKHAANKIAKYENLRPDALSLVGRALFVRFLKDRGVLKDYPVKRIAPRALDWSDCFSNPRNASDTCSWLDKTFNGDFLPLSKNGSEAFFREVDELTDGDIFHHLSAVIRGHQPVGNDYQPLLAWDWQAFDFAHIPVGLLSQVYEAFSWEWTPKEARKTSQRYTPRNIAVTLLDEVFDNQPDAANLRLLDPACGAGVFLVLAFRRLYLERWRLSKKKNRPSTEDIRQIMENQLVGLDISLEALKLAALSLYLTAIELDPAPTPPDKLRFKNLHGHVLHDVREPSTGEGAALGSLSPHLGTTFDGKFDVVLSNPPWTSVDKQLGKRLASVCRKIIERIDRNEGKKYQLPDNNPDLPFLWKATEWCKAGGRIAMALPARVLLKSEPIPSAARTTLFRLLQIDGIINGTNLADTAVWPDMSQPWMLMFATNRRPSETHGTHFVTLPLELSLNKAGEFRIDAESARQIDSNAIIEMPWLWKALSVGTMLDVEVIQKMKAAGGEALDKYWRRVVGKYRAGKGYQIAEDQPNPTSCPFLKGLPNLDSTDLFRFVVNTNELEPFSRSHAWRPRKPTIYEPPLVLIKQSPGEDRDNGRALLAFEKLAYNEAFNGYSAAGHPEGNLLVRYLHLFVHSDIWLYYLLLTSPEFGAERRRSRKADLEQFPFLPLELLTEVQKKQVLNLSRSIEKGNAIPWTDIDTLFGKLYGLNDDDLQVVRDTLSVAMPYKAARRRACLPPTERDKRGFVTDLKRSLAPFVKAGENGKLTIERWKSPATGDRVISPFEVLVLTSAERNQEDIGAIADGSLEAVLKLADETGSTQIILLESAALVVGIYNQYRYWTSSRARLLCGKILRYHLDTLTH